MPEKDKKKLPKHDVTNIKHAILESASKQCANPLELAKDTCKAIEYINSQSEEPV